MDAGSTGRGEADSAAEGIAVAGDVVGGKFVVERVLGVGGMGVVVAARHMQLGQTVAIKFLRRNAASSPESVNRFLREARAAVGLHSAHVVRVMDVGTLDDGLPYMVMEHLSGTDLAHILEVRSVLPVEEAVDYLLQAMEAIAEAHAIGIIHRDLKPSNLFLTMRPDGAPLVKVLDFGISKTLDEGSQEASLTSTAMVLGSPLYMSPEQVRSTKNVDTRTDVWALGVILYELLAGAPPFEADTVTGLCAKIVADPHVPLRSRRPDLSGALEAVVARCLDKDAKKRHQSVGALAQALRPFASNDGKSTIDRVARIGAGARSSHKSLSEMALSARSGAAAPGFEHPSGYAETVPSQSLASISQRRWGVIGWASGLVAAAVAVIWVATTGRSGVPAGRDHAATAVAATRQPPLAPIGPAAPTPSLSSETRPLVPEEPAPAPAASTRASDAGVSAAAAVASGSIRATSVTAEPPAGPMAGSGAAPGSTPLAAQLLRSAPAAARPAATRPSVPKPTGDDLLLDRK